MPVSKEVLHSCFHRRKAGAIGRHKQTEMDLIGIQWTGLDRRDS